MAVEAEARAGHRPADEHGGVEFGGQRHRVENAEDGEPLAADDHLGLGSRLGRGESTGCLLADGVTRRLR
ncbi:hypothetical protein [Streptomyces mayteni]